MEDENEETKDNTCVVCKSNKSSNLDFMQLKKLNCNHVVHIKCCEKLFNPKDSNNYNKCIIDKIIIFKGLTCLNLMSKDKENANKIGNENKENKAIKSNSKKM